MRCEDPPKIANAISSPSSASPPWYSGSNVSYTCAGGYQWSDTTSSSATGMSQCVFDESEKVLKWSDISAINCVPGELILCAEMRRACLLDISYHQSFECLDAF